jgi:hypothetical protein
MGQTASFQAKKRGKPVFSWGDAGQKRGFAQGCMRRKFRPKDGENAASLGFDRFFPRYSS